MASGIEIKRIATERRKPNDSNLMNEMQAFKPEKMKDRSDLLGMSRLTNKTNQVTPFF